MAEVIKVSFDPEGDTLEILLSDKPGSMKETADDRVMRRVDKDGKTLGLLILHVGMLQASQEPLNLELP